MFKSEICDLDFQQLTEESGIQKMKFILDKMKRDGGPHRRSCSTFFLFYSILDRNKEWLQKQIEHIVLYLKYIISFT